VLVLGGYGSAEELVRFFLTGEYGYRGVGDRREHDREIVRMFVTANADLLDAGSAALIDRVGDPEVGRRIATAPAAQEMLRALSPVNVLRALHARLLIVHGRDDPVVPFTESARLADAANPGTATLVVLDSLGHIGGDQGPDWRALTRLWAVAYRLASQVS